MNDLAAWKNFPKNIQIHCLSRGFFSPAVLALALGVLAKNGVNQIGITPNAVLQNTVWIFDELASLDQRELTDVLQARSRILPKREITVFVQLFVNDGYESGFERYR